MATVLPEPYGTEPLVTDSVVVKNPDADLKVYPDLYAAGTEPLDDNELRLTVLGSGYPSRRGQGCAGFMVELGNGEVFLFDAGSGTNAAFNHMKVPYKMTKSEPAPFLTPPDDAYVKSKGGSHTKTMHLLPDWLDESIIKIDFIEDFRRELKEQGIE